MAYKQFRNDDYISDINKKLNLINYEKPIIDKHSAFLRAKMKPQLDTIKEDSSLLNESEIRNRVIRDLSPILHNQTINFVETLSRNNDLKAFYSFYNLFIPSVKKVRNLDSSYMLSLWNKFKDKMRIQNDSSISTFPGMTAAEYEKIMNINKSVPFTSQEINEQHNMLNEDLLPIINDLNKYRNERKILEEELMIAENNRQRNIIMKNLDKLAEKESIKQDLLNKKNRLENIHQIKQNVDKITHKKKLNELKNLVEIANQIGENENMKQEEKLQREYMKIQNIDELVKKLAKQQKQRINNFLNKKQIEENVNKTIEKKKNMINKIREQEEFARSLGGYQYKSGAINLPYGITNEGKLAKKPGRKPRISIEESQHGFPIARYHSASAQGHGLIGITRNFRR